MECFHAYGINNEVREIFRYVQREKISMDNHREIPPEKNSDSGQETGLSDVEHKMIRNLIDYKLYELKEKWFWEQKCKGLKSGLYFYQLDNASIPYPFDFNEVFYIGKVVNLPERLRHHFTVDNRKRLVEKDKFKTLYQNISETKKKRSI